MNTNMNVIVTGGAGFIGSHLVEKLIRNGYYVIIIDNLFRGKLENIAHLDASRYTFFKHDLTSPDTSMLKKVIKDYMPGIIYHYAAINGTKYFYDIPYEILQSNLIATYNLLESFNDQISDSYKPVFIYASSSEVYGEPFEIPTKESSITHVRIEENRDSYAIAKLSSEFFVKLYAEKHNLHYCILRIFNVYGPKMIGTQYGQVVPEFISRIKDGEFPLNIFGDGSHSRSFIHVDDHVDMVYKVSTSSEIPSGVYNIGNPLEISIRQLGCKILSAFNLPIQINHLPEREGDHKRRMPDISLYIKYFGTPGFISLDDGINQLVKESF